MLGAPMGRGANKRGLQEPGEARHTPVNLSPALPKTGDRPKQKRLNRGSQMWPRTT
jgi:hypothetical protein